MKFEEVIRDISESFTKAWNDWDIDKLMNLVTCDVSIQSPYISKVYPDNRENRIQGKDNLRAYWTLLAETSGTFRVAQTSLKKEDNKVITHNRIVGTEIVIREIFTLNEYGKINDLIYEYLELH